MNIRPGIVLVSTPAMDDPQFLRAVLLITEYNTDGAMGFVLNKPFFDALSHQERTLNELTEFRDCVPFPLYEGGPVDQEHLFFIHRCPDLVQEGTPVTASIYSGGNFKQAVAHINQDARSGQDLKLFIGYCGWDKNELETEIRDGFWRIVPGADALLFGPAEGLFETLSLEERS